MHATLAVGRDLGGMSDLCIYELEDNVWDEFGASGDHIVPHPNNDSNEQFPIHCDNRKKPRHEVIGIVGTANNTTIDRICGKEENYLPCMTEEDRMLEKGSWSDTPDGTFPALCDSDTAKEVTSSASDDTRMSSHGSKSEKVDKAGDFCEEDPVFGDKCAAVDNNLYRYPLNQISQSDNDLSFLDNDCEDKVSSDLLYYGWPDIGNFEDVDRMFRSCDSTFGLGSLSNEDDFCWFTPANAAEDSEDVLKSGSKLNTLSGHPEASRENGAGSTNDCNQKSFTAGDKRNFKSMDTDDSAFNHLSFGSGLDTQSESKDDTMFSDQMNMEQKQLEHHNKSEGKRRFMENGGSVNHYVSQNQLADKKHLFGDSSYQVFSSSGLRQRKQNLAPDSLSYMQTHIPYAHLDYSHPSDKISVCPTPSGIKSDNNSHMSPSPKESSYASNQVQSVESSHCPPFDASSVTTNEKREKPLHCQGVQVPLTGNFKHENMENAMAFGNALPVQKQVHQSEQETEGHSDFEGVSIRVPAELDSLNAQESSCMSSVLDEISLEATSFRQLQQVMEKLDIRTKLCIRDSLYRLAKSAEQRHNCAASSASIGVDRDASDAVMAEETNKCTGYIDMETDTNPIDRSIAHLLFHRPSDPSIMHTTDTLSLKSHPTIHGSISSPPVKGEKQVCRKDTSIDADKNLLTRNMK